MKRTTLLKAMQEMGRIGGSVKSEKKAEMARKNGLLGGRPKKKNNLK